ncbi:butyrate kinase [Dethiosulfatibacter aminovorans DSM 17477]|uniref:Probable butyrate kinase n=2 Tax=Dethiosulfatibacter TaxID=448125 RepID=A0A1M6KN65_9FIRM|nr:butyrate kinase [Dethiosulfatibacter aminovorans DSM 17477]
MYNILAINPGSTSTKIALYEDEKLIQEKNITHSNEEIEKYEKITDQYEMRYSEIMNFLNEINYDVKNLSAVVGRGGLLPPVKSGAYKVNDVMVDVLKNRPVLEHASNLAAIIAYEMAEELGIPSYIYDSVAVDELDDIARYSGMVDIKRKSLSHALNMRATAISTAEEIGKPYTESNIIVAHLGGGMSVSIHKNGKMVDIVSDDEGPFSPERAGRVPCKDLISMCYKYDQKTMKAKLRGKGGLISYLGTNDAREVEKMIGEGNKEAAIIYEAMAYQIAKGIGELATVVKGKVDAIAITGGIAYSKMITDWITERVEFIAPVHIHPGENELESLVLGTIRVLDGKEEAREYKEEVRV